MRVRYGFFAALAALLLAVGLAACGSSSSDSSSSSGGETGGSETTSGEPAGGETESNGEPLKVALLPPSGGALQVFGADEVKAWEFAAEEVNAEGGVDGHEVEIVTEETDGTPEKTVQAAKKAVIQEGIHFLSGAVTSPENGALAAQLEGLEAVNLQSTAKDDIITGKQCTAWAVNVPQSVQMDANMIGKVLPELEPKSWAIQAVDYSTGHSSAEVFTKAAEENGQAVKTTQFAPLNTTEFGSYITKLGESGAEGLFAVEYGGDGVAFVQQGEQFKLFEKFKKVIGFNMVSEPLFPVLGKSIIGFDNNIGYVHGLDNPKNKEFVKAWEAKFKESPYYVQADSYIGAQSLFEAVRKAGSIEPKAVQESLDDLAFETIVGPVEIRAGDHQVLRPSYLGEVVAEKGGAGGLGWKIVGEASAAETTPEKSPECSAS